MNITKEQYAKIEKYFPIQRGNVKIDNYTFINAIFLYDDKMVITFNYKEGTTTITFDDLKTALAEQKTGSDLDCSTAPASEQNILCSDAFWLKTNR